MRLQRREFVEVAGATAASMLISPPVSGHSSLDKTETIEKNGCQLKVGPTAEIVSLTVMWL